MKPIRSLSLSTAFFLTTNVMAHAGCAPCPDPSAFTTPVCSANACSAQAQVTGETGVWYGSAQGVTSNTLAVKDLIPPPAILKGNLPSCTYKTDSPNVKFRAINMSLGNCTINPESACGPTKFTCS